MADLGLMIKTLLTIVVDSIRRTDLHRIEWLSVVRFCKLRGVTRIRKFYYDDGAVWDRVSVNRSALRGCMLGPTFTG
jgi:hypothetical protein